MFSMIVGGGGVTASTAIRGTLWEDLNRNGVREDGEPPLANQRVQFSATYLTPPLSTITDANGEYSFIFPRTAEGRISVVSPTRENPRVGLTPTQRHRGDDSTRDSDLHEEGADYNQSDLITLHQSDPLVTVDVGLVSTVDDSAVPPGIIRGRTFVADAGGIAPIEASGVDGVRVLLSDATGMVVQTFLTGSDGVYSFEVAPGTYRLVFLAPSYRIETPMRFAGSDPTRDSDVDQHGFTHHFVVRSGEIRDHLDAGYLSVISLQLKVWQDLNGNGLRDDKEPPALSEVVVQLWDRNREKNLGTQSPDQDGKVSFRVIGHHIQYRLRVVLLYTERNQYAPYRAGNDPNADSDVHHTGEDAGFTDPIVLSPEPLIQSAGMSGILRVPSAYPELGGDVFLAGPDGTMGDGGRLAGVRVELTVRRDGIITTRPIVALTDLDGRYSFSLSPLIQSGSPNLEYLVRFFPPAGYAPTPRRSAGPDRFRDSDADPEGYSEWVTVPDHIRLDIGAGFVPLTRVRGRVWNDLNANGIQEAGEPGLSGLPVRATLADKSVNWGLTHKPQWGESFTNETGEYLLELPSDGDYRIQLLREFLGDQFAPKNTGPPELDSDVHPAGPDLGFTDVLTIPWNVTEIGPFDGGLIKAPPPRTLIPFQIDSLGLVGSTRLALRFSGPVGGTYAIERFSQFDPLWRREGSLLTTAEPFTTLELARPEGGAFIFWRLRRLE